MFGTGSHGLIQETASKDWSFKIPMELTAAPARAIHSIEFDIARSDLIAFTFSLPVFWAIHMAALGWRRGFRGLLAVTMAVAALEIVLILVFVEISARGVAAQISQSQGAVEKWVLHFVGYLVADVVPYVGPFVIAAAVNPKLRLQIIGYGPGQAATDQVQKAAILRPKKQRRRIVERGFDNCLPISGSEVYFARRASRSGNVAFERVIRDHPVRAETPPQRLDGSLHAFGSSLRASRPRSRW